MRSVPQYPKQVKICSLNYDLYLPHLTFYSGHYSVNDVSKRSKVSDVCLKFYKVSQRCTITSSKSHFFWGHLV